jgi:hypothetical protein
MTFARYLLELAIWMAVLMLSLILLLLIVVSFYMIFSMIPLLVLNELLNVLMIAIPLLIIPLLIISLSEPVPPIIPNIQLFPEPLNRPFLEIAVDTLQQMIKARNFSEEKTEYLLENAVNLLQNDIEQEELKCAISLEKFTAPVYIKGENGSYNRNVLQEAFNHGPKISPVSRKQIQPGDIINVISLKELEDAMNRYAAAYDHDHAIITLKQPPSNRQLMDKNNCSSPKMHSSSQYGYFQPKPESNDDMQKETDADYELQNSA